MKKLFSVLFIANTLLVANFINEGDKAYNKNEYKTAISLYTYACDVGNTQSCSKLAFMYAKGEGVIENLKKAKELFNKSCNFGSQEGCNNYLILNSDN